MARKLSALCEIGFEFGTEGIAKGDTISVIAFNTPEMFEMHFAVPMVGAVLHAINTRLDARTVAFMLEHAQSKLLIYDLEFSPSSKKPSAC
ncbi:MAG: AMP-binding protein [Deinococcales bacterium]